MEQFPRFPEAFVVDALDDQATTVVGVHAGRPSTTLVRRFRFRLDVVPDSQKAALRSFYRRHETHTAFSFVAPDAHAYTCVFESPLAMAAFTPGFQRVSGDVVLRVVSS